MNIINTLKGPVYLSTAMSVFSHEEIMKKLNKVEEILEEKGLKTIRPAENLAGEIEIFGRYIVQSEDCGSLLVIGTNEGIKNSKDCEVEIVTASFYEKPMALYNTATDKFESLAHLIFCYKPVMRLLF